MSNDAEHVGEACETIEAGLAAFAADARQVGSLAEAVAALHWLRGQYRRRRAALEPHLPRLKECSAKLADTLKAAREPLVEAYLEAARTVAEASRTRDACRDALAELADAEGVDQFRAPGGAIEVRHVEVLTLPEKDTPQRGQLARLLTESGRWAEVGHPNAARLLRALKAGRFTADHAAKIGRLCPVETTCRLAAHLERT